MSYGKDKSYNLTTEKWIPTTDGRKSLIDIFTSGSKFNITGDPVKVYAVIQLLIGIAHDVMRDAKKVDVGDMSKSDFSKLCLEYIEKNTESFWFYHPSNPFCQDASLGSVVVSVRKALADAALAEKNANKKKPKANAENKQKEKKGIEYFLGNQNYLELIKMMGSQVSPFSSMLPTELISHADLAVNLITFLHFVPKETKSGRKAVSGGVSLGRSGHEHLIFRGENVIDTIRLNVVPLDMFDDTTTELNEIKSPHSLGFNLGFPRWNPKYKYASYQGTLVPSTRRVLLLDNGELIFTDGDSYQGCDRYYINCIKSKEKDGKISYMNVDPSKKAWREVSAILGFVHNKGCVLLKILMERNVGMIRRKKMERSKYIRLALMGVKCVVATGAQQFRGESDMLYSEFAMPVINNSDDNDALNISSEYDRIMRSYSFIESSAKVLNHAIRSYWFSASGENASLTSNRATSAMTQWWDMMDLHGNHIIMNLENVETAIPDFKRIALTVFDNVCHSHGKNVDLFVRKRKLLEKIDSNVNTYDPYAKLDKQKLKKKPNKKVGK